MRRREVITLIGGAAAWPLAARAQTPRRARMGFLSGGNSSASALITVDILKESLHELGWRIGDNLEFDARWADGDFASMPRLASELVARHPQVLASTGPTETKSLQSVTRTIPIVFLQVPVDPVSVGLVESIARPGGNITGFMAGPQFLWGKRIGLLTELLGRPPGRLAWVGNPGNVASPANWADAMNAAAKIGSELVRADIRSSADLDPVFAGLKGRDALLVQWDFLFSVERGRIAALAAEHRLPAVYENRNQALAGGLMSYGGDLRENYRQAALYVHRILNGARPADLPVIQASRFELVLNLTAAKALGLTVPTSMLLLADEVIE
jgi:putative tryptophan/tyrosine transport system substrate-binding protein